MCDTNKLSLLLEAVTKFLPAVDLSFCVHPNDTSTAAISVWTVLSVFLLKLSTKARRKIPNSSWSENVGFNVCAPSLVLGPAINYLWRQKNQNERRRFFGENFHARRSQAAAVREAAAQIGTARIRSMSTGRRALLGHSRPHNPARHVSAAWLQEIRNAIW